LFFKKAENIDFSWVDKCHPVPIAAAIPSMGCRWSLARAAKAHHAFVASSIHPCCSFLLHKKKSRGNSSVSLQKYGGAGQEAHVEPTSDRTW